MVDAGVTLTTDWQKPSDCALGHGHATNWEITCRLNYSLCLLGVTLSVAIIYDCT